MAMRGKRATSRWGRAAEYRRAIEEERPGAALSHNARLFGTPAVACSHPCAEETDPEKDPATDPETDPETDPWTSYAISEHDAAELWVLLKRLERLGDVS